MLQTSQNSVLASVTRVSSPTYPAPLAAAPTARRSYQRDPSGGSPSPAAHNRNALSRGRASQPSCDPRTSLSGERSEGGTSSVEWEEYEHYRRESRTPLWRPSKERGEGSPKGSKAERRRHRLSRLPTLLAHFLGYRPSPPTVTSPVLPGLKHVSPGAETLLLTFLGVFVSILIACAVSNALAQSFAAVPLAIGSLGATAVLLFGAPEGPLSQPRHLIGGHMISALVGVCMSYLFTLSPRFVPSEDANGSNFEHLVPVAAALAVAISVLLMQITKTVHPPGGATALIAAFRPDFSFVLLVFVSIVTMCLWACIVGNLGRRRYPVYWIAPEKDVSGGPDAPIGDDDEGALGAVGEEEAAEDEEMGERGRRPHRYA